MAPLRQFRRRNLFARTRASVGRGIPARRYARGTAAMGSMALVSLNPLSRVAARTIDLKSVETAISATVSSTGATVILSGMPQADGQGSRSGDSVLVRSFFANLTGKSDTATITSRGRVSIVWDKQPNGALATYANIYSSASPTAFKNVGNANRFDILWEKDWCNSGPSVIDQTTADTCVVLKGNRAVNKRSQFIGTDATIASIGSGVLIFAVVGNVAAGTADALLTGHVRVNFVD